MVECQEARDAWTSTSCRSEPQWGCQREEKELLPHSQFCHKGKHQCTTATTIVRSEFLSAFPESCAVNNSQSEHSSNGSLAQEVHLDNANAAVFLREAQGVSISSGSNIATIINHKIQIICFFFLCCTNIRVNISFLHV